jgi:hypothetical protein
MTAKKTTTAATTAPPMSIPEPDDRHSKPTIDQLIIKGIDAAGLGQNCIHDLGTLFKAIQETTEKNTTAHELAGIGKYLADDWWSTLSCEREELEDMRAGGAHHG